MKDTIADFFNNFGPIMFGVIVGAFAHFGQLLARGEFPPASRVIGFIMQLGLIALLAAAITQELGVKDDLLRTLTASVLTVAANEVVNWLRARGLLIAKQIETIAGPGRSED